MVSTIPGASGGSNEWLTRQFSETYQEKGREIGRFNLAIFGKTGVGKSTLINAIFGEDVAATGIGKPVTQGSHLHLHSSGHFGVLDTQGLEIGKDDGVLKAELAAYLRQMRREPLTEQIHVAWYCVRAQDRRFEDTEADFIRALDALGLPVLLVLTQVPMRDGRYHPDALELVEAIEAQDLPLSGEPVFLTYAKADDFAGYEQHGLQDLLDATFRSAPHGAQAALTAAQKIDMERKKAEASRAVKTAVAAAAAAGATPIPFADAALLVPIQLSMMATISHAYDLDLDRSATAAIAATAAATGAGRAMATGLIKMVPGMGTVVGGAITASVASAVTWAMGWAWVTVCERIAQGRLASVDGVLDSDAIRSIFVSEFRSNMRKKLPGAAE